MFHQILHFLAMKEEIDSQSNNGDKTGLSNLLPEEEIQKVIFDRQYLKFLRKKIKTDISAGLAGQQTKQKKLQYVQYECIKTELKEEYEKKISFLKNRLKKRTLKDPSFWLFSQLTHDPQMNKKGTTPQNQMK